MGEYLESRARRSHSPKLTMRVCFADKRPYDETGSQDEWLGLIMTKKEAMPIYGSYMRVVNPLR